MQSKYGGASNEAGGRAGAAGATEAEEELDANTLGAMAMEAMLAGDMEKYEALNKRLERKQAALAAPAAGASGHTLHGERVEVLEEVDGQGRSRALMTDVQSSSVQLKGKKRGTANIGTAKGGKDTGFYNDDEISLDDLIKREKVEGVQDYDSNFADHIIRKKKFKMLHEDEDEAYALGWYEGIDKKLDAKKLAEVQRRKQVMDKQRIQKNLENCSFCMDSKKFKFKDALLSVSERAYMAVDSMGSCVLPGQVIIVPQDHLQSSTDIDEATQTEMRNHQKCLVRYFESQNPPKAVIFGETNIHRVSKEKLLVGAGDHCRLIAYPIDLALLTEARAYFKKAFDEAECEWSTQHKKVIPTTAKGGVRDAIPKGFPFVHVDFSLGGGYAHVVEDGAEFPKSFVQHTIAGMCELTVLDRAYNSKEAYVEAVKNMQRAFKSFDWVSAQEGS